MSRRQRQHTHAHAPGPTHAPAPATAPPAAASPALDAVTAAGNTAACAALLHPEAPALGPWPTLIADATTLRLAGLQPQAGPGQGSNQATLAVMRLAQAPGGDAGALASLRLGGGRPLPPAVLARVNAVFGHDFAHVRLHLGPQAARLAQAAQARAFTVGHELWFNTGELDLASPDLGGGDGVELLLHELAHVVQSDEGRLPAAPGLRVSAPSDPLEREAEQRAARLTPAWEAAAWAEEEALVGAGLLSDAAWCAAVDAGPTGGPGPDAGSTLGATFARGAGPALGASRAAGPAGPLLRQEEQATPAPRLQGVRVGTWTDLTQTALTAGEELPPHPGLAGGYASRGEAVAWAGPQLVQRGADGGVVLRVGRRWFVYTLHVQSWLYDFSAANLSEGAAGDTLHADATAAPGLEGFITQDGVFVLPNTIDTVGEGGEPERQHLIPSAGPLCAPGLDDYAGLLEAARAGVLPPLGEEAAVALFKGVLKAAALDRVDQNRAALEGVRARYTPDAPGAAARWEALRALLEGDRLLEEEAQRLEAQAGGARRAREPGTRRTEPGLDAHLGALGGRLAEVHAARAALRRAVPELAALPPDAHPEHSAATLSAGLDARLNEALKAMDEVHRRVLTEDMPLTKLGPVVEAAVAALGLSPERAAAGDTLSAQVLAWLAGQDRQEALITWGGAALSITLTVGAILASGGWLAVLGLGSGAAAGLGAAGAAVGFGEAVYSLERADDLHTAGLASGAGAPAPLLDDPEATRVQLALAALNLALAGLDLGVVGRGLVLGRAARMGEVADAQRLRDTVRARAAGSAGISLTLTDDELLLIWRKGRALGLTEQELADLVYIASRDKKRRSAAELLVQLDYIIAFRMRGYPAHFHSREEFARFGAALREALERIGAPTHDLRIQGSAVRTPTADDLDLAVMMPQAQLEDILRRAYDGKIKVVDGATGRPRTLELVSMSRAEIEEWMALFEVDRGRFLNRGVFSDFRYPWQNGMLQAKSCEKEVLEVLPIKSVLKNIQVRFPELKITNVSFQTPGAKLDLQPTLPIP